MANGLISELEAVNIILAVAGDTPVQTLEDEYIQAQLARQVLTRKSRDIQSMGWWFNEDHDVELQPNTSKSILLPTNILTVEAVDCGGVVQRGNKMYNRTKRTYQFEEAIMADIVIFLEWNELPQVARDCIIDAARIDYNNSFYGDPSIENRLQDDYNRSFTLLKSKDTSGRDLNIFRNARTSSIAFRNRRGR